MARHRNKTQQKMEDLAAFEQQAVPQTSVQALTFLCIYTKVKVWSITVVGHTYRGIDISSLVSFSLKNVLINESTPILHSSLIILIKSQKMYHTGRLMRDHDHKFVRMRRIRAIRCLQFEAASFPANIVVKYIPAKNMWHRSHFYMTRQFSAVLYVPVGNEANGISGRYLHSVKLDTNRPN